jgi:hypothetical protein
MNQMQTIEKYFNELRADKVDILDNFYASDAHFEDPLGAHRGLEAVKKYYAKLYQSVESITFDFKDHISDGNNHVAFWTMTLQTPNLNSGQPMTLEGNSVIKFNSDGLVLYHRDYFDMGEFIYEQLPVLGWLVRKVKERLKN